MSGLTVNYRASRSFKALGFAGGCASLHSSLGAVLFEGVRYLTSYDPRDPAMTSIIGMISIRPRRDLRTLGIRMALSPLVESDVVDQTSSEALHLIHEPGLPLRNEVERKERRQGDEESDRCRPAAEPSVFRFARACVTTSKKPSQSSVAGSDRITRCSSRSCA